LKDAHPGEADVTIAVNGAIEFPECEINWWAAYDRPVFEKFNARPTDGIIVSFEYPKIPHEFRNHQKLYYHQLPHPEGVETGYTVLMALAAAVTHFKAGEVCFYGCDMAGVYDYNGNKPEAYGREDNETARGQSRWEREKTALKRFIEFYESEYGARIKFHGTNVCSKG